MTESGDLTRAGITVHINDNVRLQAVSEWAGCPRDAPVFHIDGPLTMAPLHCQELQRGKSYLGHGFATRPRDDGAFSCCGELLSGDPRTQRGRAWAIGGSLGVGLPGRGRRDVGGYGRSVVARVKERIGGRIIYLASARPLTPLLRFRKNIRELTDP